jgi:hypothetical protein
MHYTTTRPEPGSGMARSGAVRQGGARPASARPGTASQGGARQGMARQGLVLLYVDEGHGTAGVPRVCSVRQTEEGQAASRVGCGTPRCGGPWRGLAGLAMVWSAQARLGRARYGQQHDRASLGTARHAEPSQGMAHSPLGRGEIRQAVAWRGQPTSRRAQAGRAMAGLGAAWRGLATVRRGAVGNGTASFAPVRHGAARFRQEGFAPAGLGQAGPGRAGCGMART